MRHPLTLMLALLAAVPSLDAQRLPLVEVTFSLAQSGYKDAFTSAEGFQNFETNVARSLETVLAGRIGFVQFGHDPAAQRLHIRVERETTQVGTDLAAMLFAIELERWDHSLLAVDPRWEFLAGGAYPVPVERLAATITNWFDSRLEDHRTALVGLLSDISLAQEVYLVPHSPTAYCVLPISYDLIDAVPEDTLFEFETLSSGPFAASQHHGAKGIDASASGLTNLPPAYTNGIVAAENSGAVRSGHIHTPLNTLGTTNGPLVGKALHVTAYRRRILWSVSGHSPAAYQPGP